MVESRTGVTRTLVFVVMVTMLRSCLALYRREGDLLFCDALGHCSDMGGNLPVVTDSAPLKGFMGRQMDVISATWVLYGAVSNKTVIDDALAYCNGTKARDICPAHVLLHEAVDVLRAPLANCTHSSADMAVCQPPSGIEIIKDFFFGWFSQRTPATNPLIRVGSFCDAVAICRGEPSRKLVESYDDGTDDIDKIQKFLQNKESSSCWALSEDDENMVSSYCNLVSAHGPAGNSECPGKIILHKKTDLLKGSLVGCDVPLPAICDLPYTSIEGTTSDVTPSLTMYDSAAGQKESGRGDDMPLIIGVVVGGLILIVIIIIVIAVLVRIKKASRPASDAKVQDVNMDGHKLTYEMNASDIRTRSSENEYAAVSDVIDNAVAKTWSPTDAGPPPIGADPGYMEIRDRAGENGGFLGTYEDIDSVREDSKLDKSSNEKTVTNGTRFESAQEVPRSENLTDTVDQASHQNVATALPVYAQPIKPVTPNGEDPYEVTLVENMVYE